jgi:uncharacterized membrane protein YbhN (UPF0104 family)
MSLETLTHKATAYAQILLSAVFIGGYFFVLYLFLDGHVKVPPEFKDTFGTLLGVITGGVLLILNYWFARQRQSTDKDST